MGATSRLEYGSGEQSIRTLSDELLPLNCGLQLFKLLAGNGREGRLQIWYSYTKQVKVGLHVLVEHLRGEVIAV